MSLKPLTNDPWRATASLTISPSCITGRLQTRQVGTALMICSHVPPVWALSCAHGSVSVSRSLSALWACADWDPDRFTHVATSSDETCGTKQLDP